MLPTIAFDHSYARELEGFYAPWQPARVAKPSIRFLNDELAASLCIQLQSHTAEERADLFSGNALPEGAMPIVQAYAGHQFGHFSPQLGDGRALLLGEVIDGEGIRRDIAFKGSGRTPFSRGGDGRAAVGPMLREVLIGEAMHALGIPTTRALAVVATGEPVYRDEALPGAVLTRVAQSHIRVGTFEFFAARGEFDRVKQLADYTIARHYPDLVGDADCYVKLLREFAQRQASLIAQWMNVGFIHGVMNTDNMTLSGETIDYGPCAFMEAFDPAAVFSSIDKNGRYAYGNQPNIARWNIAKFAETLIPLLDADEDKAIHLANDVLEAFPDIYQTHWLTGVRAKLGLSENSTIDSTEDLKLAVDWLSLLHANKTDFTLAWRRLADAVHGNAPILRVLIADHVALDAWLARWQMRCTRDDLSPAERHAAMCAFNPIIIPRNHLVEEVLRAASDHGNDAPFTELLAAVRQPYAETPALARFFEPAPVEVTAGYKTFCGT
jgi:serine/tyrosine/threonine adenylyltransferase